MIAVVLDTNIVVSALIAPKGNEAVVLSLALRPCLRSTKKSSIVHA